MNLQLYIPRWLLLRKGFLSIQTLFFFSTPTILITNSHNARIIKKNYPLLLQQLGAMPYDAGIDVQLSMQYSVERVSGCRYFLRCFATLFPPHQSQHTQIAGNIVFVA